MTSTTEAPSQAAPKQFIEGIGPLAAVSLVVGTMIGSGIFIVSADIGRQVDAWGPGALMIVWIVTGLMTVTGALAYAELAGLPAVTGLWAAIGALMVYAVLGSSQRLSVGPESTTALMTAAALGSVTTPATSPAAMASALAFVVAGFCLIGWIARLAALADLLSRPVLIGYLAGIAGIMVVSQFGKLLGIEVQGEGFLTELGYDDEEISRLENAGVVIPPSPAG